jgi:hypothetical protein
MSDTAVGVLLLLMATASMVAAATAWIGLWRSWARQFLFGAIGSSPITLLPSIALMAASAGLSFVGAAKAGSTFVSLTFLAGVAFLVLFVWNPRWWGPRWYREVRAGLEGGTVKADLRDPITALMVGALRLPQETSGDVVSQHTSGEPLESWSAAWINGAETAKTTRAFERSGAVDGRLELRTGTIVFAANKMEDRIRGAATVAVVSASELSGAWAVPPGCGPDGVRTSARGLTAVLARHIVPRLVIATNDGVSLFETYGADKKAEHIRELYGLRRPTS